MKLKTALFVLISLQVTVMKAQDTTWLNDLELPCDKAHAIYFRPVPVKDSAAYKVTDYYMNGQVYMEGEYASLSPSTREGTFVFYYPNGRKKESGRYVKNIRYGPWKRMFEDTGRVQCVTIHHKPDADTLVSITSFYRSGKVKRKEYITEKVDTGICYNEEGKEIPFTPFIVSPEFKDGNINMFLAKYIRYPDDCREGWIMGRVLLGFIVRADGTKSEPVVVYDPHPSLSNEAQRVVSLAKAWIPGKIDDQPADMPHVLPVTFRLE